MAPLNKIVYKYRDDMVHFLEAIISPIEDAEESSWEETASDQSEVPNSSPSPSFHPKTSTSPSPRA